MKVRAITPSYLLLIAWLMLAPRALSAVAPCVTLTCPSGVNVECASTNGAVARFTVSARTACGRSARVDCSPASGSTFRPGPTTVTCVATDDLGNTARCEFLVRVTDTTPPILSPPDPITVACAGPAGAVVSYQVGITDACDPSPRVLCYPPSGSVFPIGSTTVECAGIDDTRNEAKARFPVNVRSGCTADCLQIDCAHDLTAGAISRPSRVVYFGLSATNLCGGYQVPVSCRPPSGTAFPLGSTTVNCTATNLGAVQRCTFHITVRDETPPVIQVPGTITVSCQKPIAGQRDGAAVVYPIKVADNIDAQPTVVCTPPSGSWLHLGTNGVTCVASDAAGNKATNQFVVIVKSGPACLADDPVTEFSPDNWGFELGLASWVDSGSAFEFQPVFGNTMRVKRIPQLKQQMDDKIGGGYWQDITYRIGFRGEYWIGTADNYTVPQGWLFDSEQPSDTRTGELRSKPFTIQKPYITFLVGGTQDPEKLRVELLTKADPGTPNTIQIGAEKYQVEYSTTGHGQERLHRATWSVDNAFHHAIGKKAFIRIVDESTTGHINVDDFQFVDTHPLGQKVKVGEREYPAVVKLDEFYYDWDSPIWGVVDLHTHPMSYLGFAEGVMHGMPDGGAADPNDIEAALSDCNCLHGGKNLINDDCGNYLRQALQMGTDSVGNDSHREGWSSPNIVSNGTTNDYGRFRHWPVFSTKTHQQMWHEWIRRAYDGGLRTMVALCVNNALLGSASEGPGPLDDLTVGDNQIRAMKEFAARHDDFMEIAYDPFQLRDIVRRNKLAVILGSELDDIGNLIRDPNVRSNLVNGELEAYSQRAITNAVHHLYTNGVRYIFPVHLVNNKFGGTPIADVMLNIANRFVNNEALEVEPADPADHLRFRLPEYFDLGVTILEHQDELILGAVALPAVLPLLPALTDIFGTTVGLPPGAGSAIGAGLLPVALLGAIDALPNALKAIPPTVWPINFNYPRYPDGGEAPWGHRNVRGLTTLGEFAVHEMMKRGMMIDVDHMSQKTLNAVFAMAEQNPVGYPLNSGHNNFRALAGEDSAENHRSKEQMDHIRELGGLFGVGYENANTASLAEAWLTERTFTKSEVPNDCAGTSKTVNQIYLYALEAMDGHRVGLGTDVNGFIPGPGPRFGPNSDFANRSPWEKAKRIRRQANGVRYTPEHGRPLVGPVFKGEGVDPDKEWGFPNDERFGDNWSLKPGYAYSKMQRDFFPAIRIFHYLEPKVAPLGGWTLSQVTSEIEKIKSVLDGDYNNGQVADLALGLLKGIKVWPADNYTQYFARLVYLEEVIGLPVPDEFTDQWGSFPYDLDYELLMSLRAVWYDYHQAFGANPPLRRGKTGPKDWDINFEGVAHYGMLPDLFQDMSNVGLETADLSPLFQSAEDFAQMWTKTVRAADELAHPRIYLPPKVKAGDGSFSLEWLGEPGDRLEESSDLGVRSGWHPSDAELHYENGIAKATVKLDPNLPRRFFRIRR